MRDGKLFVNPAGRRVSTKGNEGKFNQENTTANTCVNSHAKDTIALQPNVLLTGIQWLKVINI
jgi:hypothetical protein